MRRIGFLVAGVALVTSVAALVAGSASAAVVGPPGLAPAAVVGGAAPASSTSGGPEGISCPTSRWCAAVGTVQTVTADHRLVEKPAAWIADAGHWTHRLLPLPAGVATLPEAYTGSVSCPSVGSCVAIGAFYLPGSTVRTKLFAETLSAGRWTVKTIDLPTGTGTSIFSAPGRSEPGISCSSLTACTAVFAVQGPNFNFAVPAVWRLRGTNWTARSLPPPPGTTPGNRIAILDAVSCADATHCVAVGSHQDSAHHMVPLIESYAGGRWIATDGLIGGRDSAYLDGVDCPAVTECRAVGFVQEIPSSAVQHPVVVTARQGRWALRSLPLVGGVTSAAFRSVSCQTVRQCVAVGWSGELVNRPQAERLANGRWVADSPDTRLPLHTVSCPSPSRCVATTGSGIPARDRVDTLVDGHWSNRSVGLPS